MIETERLILRPWKTEDAEALYKYASDGKVSELALWPRHTSVEMSKFVIEEIFMPNQDTFAIVLKNTGEAVGCVGLVPEGDEHFPAEEREREAGYWIGAPLWNKGLTTEALNALIAFYKEKGYPDSLLITTDSRNTASQRVAVKCGFHFIKDYINDGIPSKAYRLLLR